MNKSIENDNIGTVQLGDLNPGSWPDNAAPAFIKNEKTADTAPVNAGAADKEISNEAIKEPQNPVPAQDEINPPLNATLGGDDLFNPLEKK